MIVSFSEAAWRGAGALELDFRAGSAESATRFGSCGGGSFCVAGVCVDGCFGAGGCGPYFFNMGWNSIMTTKVNARMRSSFRSIPGSC
jgi:hypothetical protein